MAAGLNESSRRVLAKLALTARRRGVRPPAFVKRLLRRAMVPDLEAVTLEGWTRPLIGDGLLGEPPIDGLTLQAGYQTPAAEENPLATLKCLVAVGECDAGGSAYVAALLTRRLGEHGIATALAYTPDEPGVGSSRLADQLRSEGRAVNEILDAVAAGTLLDAERFEVISAHGAPGWWVDVASARGIPMIETLHLPPGIMYEDRRAEAARAQRLTGVIAVSELLRSEYLSLVPGLDPGAVTVIPNGIDDRRLPHVDRAQARAWLGLTDEFLFVSLARFSAQKNPIGLISAFDRVAAEHPDVHLLIAGALIDSRYVVELRQQLSVLTGRNRVHLRDHTPWPSALLAAADAFVLDSFFEAGFVLAAMEALYAGVPVLISDVAGAREQMEEGRSGYLVANPLGDPLGVTWETVGAHAYRVQENHDELVTAMKRVIDERVEWAARRGELTKWATDRFGADRSLALHAKAILAARGGAPAVV
jgi:glycosyltransferase involved in cell wall biosynthesis